MPPEQHFEPTQQQPEHSSENTLEPVAATEEATAKPKKQFFSTPIAVLLGALIIAAALFFALKKPAAPTTAQEQAKQPPVPTSVDSKVVTIRPDDYVRGNRNAPLVVFEYSDSDCPFCQKFHPTLQQVLKDYNGSVAWVYRFFPLSIHPNAYTEALALNCVGTVGGTDSFWKYLDTIINVTLNPDPESNKTLLTIAASQGINSNKLTACLKDPKSTAKIDSDVDEAGKIGARGTPFSIVVNTKTGKQVVIPGAYPIDYVKQAIDSIK